VKSDPSESRLDQNILRMVFDKVQLGNNDQIRCMNNPLLHALIVFMFQFDTKLFKLQLLPLKTDVNFRLQYSTKRYFIRKKTSRVQRTKFYESNSYFVDALSSKVRMNREKIAAILFHFI
jgi:hypothetical protein